MTRFIAAILLAASSLSAKPIYDLLLKNGRVIDPPNHRESQILDVAMIGTRIAKVAANLPAAHAHIVVDVSGSIVAPGLIDINTHFGSMLKPDYNTLPHGVTTAVDVGTATCETFPDFKKRTIDETKVRLLAFLSATDENARRA